MSRSAENETEALDGPSAVGRLAVLVSGSGTNLQAIIDACSSGRLNAEVAVVVSNNPDAFALARADQVGIPTVVAAMDDRSRGEYDTGLAQTISSIDVDLVVLAGWDRLLSSAFVSRFPVINLHPAKPGAFPGLGAIEKAYTSWIAGTIDSGGVMVHFVPDEGVDNGPVILTEDVAFRQDDTLESFAERVHRTEHRLLVAAISKVLPTIGTMTLR